MLKPCNLRVELLQKTGNLRLRRSPSWGFYGFLLLIFVSKKPGRRWFPRCMMISPHHVATETACLKQRNFGGGQEISWFPNEISHVQGMKRVSGYPYIWIDTAPSVWIPRPTFATKLPSLLPDDLLKKWRCRTLSVCHGENSVITWWFQLSFFLWTPGFCWKVSSLNIRQMGDLAWFQCSQLPLDSFGT